MNRKASLLRARIPLLQERVELLEEFLSLGLKKVDVGRACGVSLPYISQFFSGRVDSAQVEAQIRNMIIGARNEKNHKASA